MKFTITKFTVFVAEEAGDAKRQPPVTAQQLNDKLGDFPFRRVITEQIHTHASSDEVRRIAGLPFDSHLHDSLSLKE